MLLLASAPAYWAWWLYGGLYARCTGLIPVGLALLAAPYIARSSLGALYALAAAALLSFAVMLHPISGAIAWVIVSVSVLLNPLASLRRRAAFIAAISVLTLGYSASYVIMFLISNPTSTGLGGITYDPAPLSYLVAPTVDSIGPVAIATGVLAAAYAAKRKGLLRSPAAYASLAIMLPALSYAFIGYLPQYSKSWYINGLPPYAALHIAALGGAILAGLLLSELRASRRVAAGILLLTLAAMLPYLSTLAGAGVGAKLNEAAIQRRLKALSEAQVEPGYQYRVGTACDAFSAWLDYYTSILQSRGYYAQGAPYISWQHWLEYAVWSRRENPEETEVLLEWHAIKWVSAESPQEARKFLESPAYRLVASEGAWMLFEYKRAAEIAECTNTPTILFIGSDVNYDVVLRVFAISNLSSRRVVLVKGDSMYIDDYSLSEFMKFDALLLYGYRYHSREQAFKLLSSYVRSGGSVLLEANGSPDCFSPALPEPFPVKEAFTGCCRLTWNFTKHGELMEDIGVGGFSPPVYDRGPWAISFSMRLRSWAKPALLIGNRTVLAYGSLEEGKVVWSGINIIYHTLTYKSTEERKLIASIVGWLTESASETPLFEVEFQSPDKRVIRVYSPAKGVLLRERYFRQWRAYVSSPGGEMPARIYLAGPGMMYIPLRGCKPPAEVILEYHELPAEKAAPVISAATVIASLLTAAWVLRRQSQAMLPQM